MALYYCRKCGRIAQESYGQNEQICDCCRSIMNLVPKDYLLEGFDFILKDNDSEQILREELVKTSSEFDQYLFDHRDEIIEKQSAEFNAKMEHGRAVLEGRDKGNNFGVECPYCHATNVYKITNTSKAIHTAIFGLFSVSRNSKNYHCNHCGSDF